MIAFFLYFKCRLLFHVLCALLVILSIALNANSVNAASSYQRDDPVEQCVNGEKLFYANETSEALPLLEIGFISRDQGIFTKPDDLGRCALILGILRNNVGKSNAALDALKVAFSIFNGSSNKRLESITLSNMGVVYHNQGHYRDALYSHQQALEIAREMGDRAGEGAELNNIGSAYTAQGRYSDAINILQQALVILRETDDRQGVGIALHNIGDVYSRQGRYKQAFDYLHQALNSLRAVDDRRAEGITLDYLGSTYESLGDYSQAESYYQRALIIARDIENKRGEVSVLNNLGIFYKNQKRYTEALKYLQQALTIVREMDEQVGEGMTLNNIGEVYSVQGQYTDAAVSLEQALLIEREVSEQREGEGITLSNIGVVYEKQGRFTESLEYDEQAMTIFEALRTTAGSESARVSYIAQYTFLYNHSVRLYYQQNQTEKAFLATERGRARAFLDALSTGYVELSDNDAATIYTEEQEAYAARQSAQKALAKAKTQNPPDQDLISDLETQLAQAEKDYQAALDAISQRNSYLEQLIPGRSKVLDLTQAQALLDDQTTLLSFWVLDNQTLVFVLTDKTFNTVSLPISRKDLYAKIKALRDFANIDGAYPENAVALYQVLIEPLKTYLSTPNLVIIPHGELHYLPFAALTDGKRYLMDDYSITYLPSISAWPYIKQNAGRANTNPLIIGNPATDQTELQPLPFAESEAQAIAGLYQTTVLLGDAATEGVVRSQVGHAGVLHLAAHGSYNTANPLYSAIYLAPDGQNDGLLETHEIYGLDLKKADLVVLSACDTQLGELSTGDELVGLTRAFFFAGTPSVISSLWSVDDKATKLLMGKFYTYWRGGMSKAEALRRAQVDARAEYNNPYYWAGFVLSGDGGEMTGARIPIDTSHQTSTPISGTFPHCGAGLTIIGIVIAWQTKKRRKLSDANAIRLF